MRFFDKCISHCYVMIKSEGGEIWQIIEPNTSHLDISIEFVQEYPYPRLYAGPEAVILPVRAFIGTRPRWGVCIFSCVDVVKSILGIKSFWTMTPYQLYKYLVKERGKAA